MPQTGFEPTNSCPWLVEWSLSAFGHTDSCFQKVESRTYKNKPRLISVDRSLLSYCTVICIRRTPLPKAAKGSFFQKVLMHLSSFPTYEPNCFPEIFKLASKAQPSCPYKSLSCQILKHSIFLSTFQSLLKLIVKFQFGLYVWRYDKFISTFWKKLTLPTVVLKFFNYTLWKDENRKNFVKTFEKSYEVCEESNPQSRRLSWTKFLWNPHLIFAFWPCQLDIYRINAVKLLPTF